MQFELDKIQLDLKVNWKLSRNETLYKENFVFKMIDGADTGLGEIAPNIRYGETTEKIQKDFDFFVKEFNHQNLYEFLYQNEFSHAFQFAVESAYTHLCAKKEKKTISTFLGIPRPVSVATSYSVPIMDEQDLSDYLNQIERFKYIKIKVNQDNAVDFVKAIAKKIDRPLRVDGNEAWSDLDSYKRFEDAIKNLNIEFIEQPMPSQNIDDYIALRKNSNFEIMADESIEQNADFELLAKQFHSINVKLMKAGGYQKAIALLQQAHKFNLKTMLGCMIETSLGISCALNLSGLADYFDLDGSLLIKNDPYDFISEKDGTLFLT